MPLTSGIPSMKGGFLIYFDLVDIVLCYFLKYLFYLCWLLYFIQYHDKRQDVFILHQIFYGIFVERYKFVTEVLNDIKAEDIEDYTNRFIPLFLEEKDADSINGV